MKKDKKQHNGNSRAFPEQRTGGDSEIALL
jgi:hypothetical protein